MYRLKAQKTTDINLNIRSEDRELGINEDCKSQDRSEQINSVRKNNKANLIRIEI